MEKHIKLILVMVFLLGGPGAINGHASDKSKPLTNASIISLVKADLGNSAIIALIKTSPSDFDKSPEALIELKRSGVSSAIIEAMASAGAGSSSVEAPVAEKKEELPSSYGFYALGRRGAQELRMSPVSAVFGLKLGGLRSGSGRGMCMDGLAGEPQNVVADASRGFIVYQQNIDPGAFVLAELVYVNSVRAADFNVLGTNPAFFQNVYRANPSDRIEVNLWRPSGKVEFRVEPVEGRNGMFKLLPVSALKAGRYALYSGEEIHDSNVVFTADTNRRASAIFFSISQAAVATRTTDDGTPQHKYALSGGAVAGGNIVGTWSGLVNEPGRKPYKMVMRIESPEVGRTEYAIGNCTGSLSGGPAGPNAYKYTETITAGHCLNGTIMVQFADSRNLSLLGEAMYKGKIYRITASLEKESN